MILIDNIQILKNNYPDTWATIKPLEEKELQVKVVAAKNGLPTLVLEQNGSVQYIHSKYDPQREAATFIEQFANEVLSKYKHIIFYGVGLGYHIEEFINRYSPEKISIYEPNPEIFYSFVSHNDLSSSKWRALENIFVETKPEDSIRFIQNFISYSTEELLFVVLPSYTRLFKENYEDFSQNFKKIIKDKRASLRTNFAFQKRWIINSMINFKEVLSTPNILLEKKGQFKGMTAILVAAGPSLNDEIENLRYIKENGLAYIFSVGSAVNTLIHNDIYPHAACTYDPTAFNQNVFKTIKEKGIKEIPMIFGSSVGYETPKNYPGAKYHMITSQDTVASYFLKIRNDEAISIVQDAPSIAVITLQLLHMLGFTNIILVGQNLGYRGKERYSEGIFYSRELTEKEIERGIWVKDVYGHEILTNESFNSMRKQMERYIKLLPDINVINTTKSGANIEGAKFVELEEIIETALKEKIVVENWLEGNKTNYDKEHLISQLNKMDESYHEALKINRDYYSILTKIEKEINNNNYNQAEKLYVKLNKEIKRLENNDFYKTFILPRNRVQHKILADSIDNLYAERNPYNKGKRIVDSYRKFIKICNGDIRMIEPLYKEMKEHIVNFSGWSE